MSQHKLLITTLKHALKSQGRTYHDVAQCLCLSEASVKRLFSDQSFTLQRLEDICHLIDMEITDLVQLMYEQNTIHLSQLSAAQESEIANDIGLLLVTVCILNKWRFNNITDYFTISETQCIRYLAKLDNLKLIELLPNNRIKLLVAANFKWRENGPIQQFFLQKLGADFFSSKFTKKNEKLIVINGMLSESSQTILQRKMDQFAIEFNSLNKNDANLDIEQRFGVTLVLANRSWDYGLFDNIRKNKI